MRWDIKGIRAKSRDNVCAMGGKNMKREEEQSKCLEISTARVVIVEIDQLLLFLGFQKFCPVVGLYQKA